MSRSKAREMYFMRMEVKTELKENGHYTIPTCDGDLTFTCKKSLYGYTCNFYGYLIEETHMYMTLSEAANAIVRYIDSIHNQYENSTNWIHDVGIEI